MLFKNSHILLTTATALTIVFSSCKEHKKQVKQAEITFKKEGELTLLKAKTDSIIQKLDIEIADSDYERQTGLMYRNSMKSNHGMLFIFTDMRPRSFYMKNTHIPLDLIYLDNSNTVVSFQENAKPFDESSLPSRAAAQYVLEVNAGLVNKWHLEPGDTMQFSKTE